MSEKMRIFRWGKGRYIELGRWVLNDHGKRKDGWYIKMKTIRIDGDRTLDLLMTVRGIIGELEAIINEIMRPPEPEV